MNDVALAVPRKDCADSEPPPLQAPPARGESSEDPEMIGAIALSVFALTEPLSGPPLMPGKLVNSDEGPEEPGSVEERHLLGSNNRCGGAPEAADDEQTVCLFGVFAADFELSDGVPLPNTCRKLISAAGADLRDGLLYCLGLCAFPFSFCFTPSSAKSTPSCHVSEWYPSPCEEEDTCELTCDISSSLSSPCSRIVLLALPPWDSGGDVFRPKDFRWELVVDLRLGLALEASTEDWGGDPFDLPLFPEAKLFILGLALPGETGDPSPSLLP